MASTSPTFKTYTLPKMDRKVTLDSLPVELLSQIATCFDHARSLLHLSLTCKRLRDFVAREGWHAFVSSHFPEYNGPPLWQDAAHSLTSLSKSWDKRALNARFILPQSNINVRHLRRRSHRRSSTGSNGAPSGAPNGPAASRHTNARPPQRDRNRRQAGQTMGYHPVLDCAEYWGGKAWTDREEVLAVGAGAEILIRNQSLQTSMSTQSLDQGLGSMSLNDSWTTTDDHGHKSSWRSWRDERFMDGKDDISTLKMLRASNDEQAWANEMVVGRASGALERLRIDKDQVSVVSTFVTRGRSVRSMNMSSPGGGMLAAGLGNRDIALYKVDSVENDIQPIQEFSSLCQGGSARTWSTQFLGPQRLAIGHGIAEKPLDIYEVRPDGVSEQPLRRFPALREQSYGPAANPAREAADAVYSIASIPDSSRGTNNPSNVFATGWYSAAIRLHDMRSPEPAVATFVDPLEIGAAVYSILPVGMDRIVAGTALHAKMQVFDLRSPPVKSYVAPGIRMPAQHTDGKKNGYSLFLARDFKSSRKESSVYSLAMASPFSSTVYAGLEASVMQIDLFSSTDKHPDATYLPSPDNRVRNQRERHYASLAMMDYSGSNKLLIQRYFGKRQMGLWDDRWLNLT